MSIFSNLDTANVTADKDILGGGYSPLETDIYEATIKAVYITVSRSGAMAANLVADIDGREYREQLWITNREGKPYYLSKKSGEKIFLPGFTIMNDICLCTTGKELKQLEPELRTVKIYDFDTKQELPKEVPTIVELQDCVVDLGIVYEVIDKTAKNDAGVYVPTGETKEQNVINKVFHHESHRTVNEAREHKDASFYDKWLEKNKGQIRNRAKGVAEAPKGGMPGMPSKPMNQSAPKPAPLFS